VEGHEGEDPARGAARAHVPQGAPAGLISTRLEAAIEEAGNVSTAIGLVGQSASLDPDRFAGVWAFSGTYGAFTRLMYRPARVWGQQNQDSKFRTGMRHILAGLGVLLATLLALVTTLGAQDGSRGPSAPEALPGTPAPQHVVAEIHQALAEAVDRFHAMDVPGVLGHVSERYRSGPLTKPLLAEQLRALFAVHDHVTAGVRIDAVRMVGEDAWVYSTGHVTGRLRWIGGSVPVLAWQHEPQMARREAGRWRLLGDR
jgi:hypothetical protein